MTQQTSPWIEGKYGWNLGESGWNGGMDENLLKFSFLFDGNIDGVVSSLPLEVNGKAYFLTTDNRLYFVAGNTYYSTNTPLWFSLTLRTTGDVYQFNGTSLVPVSSNSNLETRVVSLEATIASLGSAAYEDVTAFTTPSDLTALEAEFSDTSSGSGTDKIGDTRYQIPLTESLSKLPYYLSAGGLPSGGDDLAALQALLDSVSLAGGGKIIFDSALPYFISDALHVKSNTTLEWLDGAGFLTLTQASTVGHVIAAYAGSTALPPVENITFINPKIDGGNLGYVAGNPFGENGLSGTRCKHVRSYGGEVRNCYEGALRHYGTGGNAVQFEAGVDDILVSGLTIRNCSNGLSTQGLVNDVAPADMRTSTAVKYTDIKMYNCNRIAGVFQAFSPPSADVKVLSIVFDGIQAYDCGIGRTGTGGDTSLPTDMGAINIDRGVNVDMKNINIYNNSTYGTLDSVVRMIRGEANNFEIKLYGSATTLVKHVVPVAGAGFAFSGNLRRNTYDITCYGIVTNAININRSDTSGTLVDQTYDFKTVSITGNLIVLDTSTLGGTNIARFHDITTGKTLQGLAELIRTGTNAFPTEINSTQSTTRINGLSFSFGTGTNSILADATLNVFAAGVQRMSLTSANTLILGLPTFADNTAAAALPTGALYRTATGQLMVKF